MSSLESLIEKARQLHSEGHTASQIADELSLSIETITWLLTQKREGEAPKDIHIDWTAVAGRSAQLHDIALMMLRNLYYQLYEGGESPEPEVVIGVAHSGIPLATLIAEEADLMLSTYHPKKHAAGDHPVGSMSSNFSQVDKRQCIIVDDVITTGNTMEDLVDFLMKHGAKPVAIIVIFDKKGVSSVEGVPVYPLFRLSRID